MPTIYKITYPNGKIYVGQDLTDTLTYFGSPRSNYVAADFPDAASKPFVVSKEILWFDALASKQETSKKEVESILALQSNNPSVGYNRWPRFKSIGVETS